ncbi:MAG: hypothetical protein ACI9UA_003750 [Pseudoalteromonas tetraodonis]|jgi:hypothetical protein
MRLAMVNVYSTPTPHSLVYLSQWMMMLLYFDKSILTGSESLWSPLLDLSFATSFAPVVALLLLSDPAAVGERKTWWSVRRRLECNIPLKVRQQWLITMLKNIRREDRENRSPLPIDAGSSNLVELHSFPRQGNRARNLLRACMGELLGFAKKNRDNLSPERTERSRKILAAQREG